jgi:hypothetical protein
MLGWIAVHVHANKVAVQLQIMSHNVLLLQMDEESRTSSVGIVVLLQLDSEAQTNGTHKEIAKSKVMVKLRTFVHCT